MAAILTAPAVAGRPEACASPQHRQLDFKIGEFDVTAANGARAGDSRVVSLLGGCLLVEHWHGAVSGYGQGTFYFDQHRGEWRMVFVNDDGAVLDMAGRQVGDAIVLKGENAFGEFRGLHRMSWSPTADHGVLQVWDYSIDGGATWKPIFTGSYARRGGAPAPPDQQ